MQTATTTHRESQEEPRELSNGILSNQFYFPAKGSLLTSYSNRSYYEEGESLEEKEGQRRRRRGLLSRKKVILGPHVQT